jgi:hypothetical protein
VQADPDPVEAVVRGAAELRAEGAESVVLALHDGVDAGNVDRMWALSDAVRDRVDLVLGGHTLRCFAGTLAGVPFLQPWGFGSQVGVADLGDDGVRLRLVDVGPERPWEGVGAAAQAALEAEVVGRLPRALVQAHGRDTSLAREIGDGVLRRDGALDRVYVGPADLWTQPARDGVDALLPAGDVTLAQVLRLTPLTGARSAWGGELLAAEMPVDEADAVLARLDPGTVAQRGGRAGGTLALSAFHAAVADRALGRQHGWQPIAGTLRDGLLAAVAR